MTTPISMKVITLTTIFIFLNGIFYGQDCLPAGASFTLQSELDAFILNNPNCTIIGDTIRISNVSDLTPLMNIEQIHGSLIIEESDIADINLPKLSYVEDHIFIAG